MIWTGVPSISILHWGSFFFGSNALQPFQKLDYIQNSRVQKSEASSLDASILFVFSKSNTVFVSLQTILSTEQFEWGVEC